MRPQGDHILKTVAMTLEQKFLPTLETEHAQAEMGLSAILMGIVAEEFDRAIQRRIEENQELVKVFSAALAVVKDEDLKKRVKEASEKTTDDYTVKALDKLNCELLTVLIDLHVHVEALEGEDARKIEAAIWNELENGVKRREFNLE